MLRLPPVEYPAGANVSLIGKGRAVMAGFRTTLSVLAALCCATTPDVWADDAPIRRAVVVENTDFFGGDLDPVFNTTFDACEQLCLDDTACTAFTYNTKSDACFPKADAGEMRAFDGAVSARIVEIPKEILTRITTRAAELSFLPGGYIAEAHALARSIGVEYPSSDQGMPRLLAEARNASPRRAVRLYGAALNIEDAADVWRDLSRAYLRIEAGSYQERRHLIQRGTSASINGFLRAERPSTQSSALNQLAKALEQRGDGREMIDALRLSQRLTRRDDTQAALDTAIGKYGFRVLKHTVDSNAADPRICVAFSEGLKAATDYDPFVRINKQDLPVEAEGSQLCIDGVAHGSRYKFTLREGLPAASGESLNRSIDLDVYVRDRKPAVRFTGRAYLLPKSATASIPVVTVNLDEVALRIHRVGVRNLRSVAQRNMLGEVLDGYDEREIAAELGIPVWEGAGDVGNRLNEDITTALPVGDAIRKFEPGVYVMTARTATSEDWTNAATQWFVVTDLGLTTLTGSDGLHVFARSLASAEAIAGAEVQLIAGNNEVLGTAKTNNEGYLVFAPGLTRGDRGMAPAMLTIEDAGGDFAFLDLTESGFDLADRGVEGRESPGPLDVFISTERGAYRPGETVHATVLLRDARAAAVADLPLTAIVSRPDGVEHSRAVLKDEGAGGRSHSFGLQAAAARGGWEIAIYADPKAPALAREMFLVEDFTPERIDFDIGIAAEKIRLTDVPDLSITGRYLYGAPAADLPISGAVRVTAAKELDAYPGFSFGDETERVTAEVETFSAGLKTDKNGKAVIPLSLPAMQGVVQPMKLEAIVRLRDGSGRPVERILQRPIMPVAPLIGIKPLFEDTVAQGGLARFEVIGVDRDGQRGGFDSVGWEVSKVNTRYQWYEVNGSWRYEPTTSRERIASGNISIDPQQAAVIETPVTWGRYELKLVATEGEYTASSVRFDAGWYAPVAGSDTPDTLQVSLDKERYKSGDTAKLRVNARFAGKVFVAALDNRLIDMRVVDVDPGETVIDMPVTDAWGAGAYLTATLIRPMDVEAGRNPSRAIGLQWAEIDPAERKLDVSFLTPDAVDPRAEMRATLKVSNLPDGTRAYATIAAVDVGVLNITGFDSPKPDEHYFGQRRLGIDIRDVYGRLIDGSLGTPGRIRSGGDGPASGKTAPPPNEDVLAFFSGVLEVGEDGTAHADFLMPDFNGTVKLMAVVWSDDGVGSAEKDVQVADPIVVSVSAPRFLAPGDQSRVLVELAHVSGSKGETKLDIVSDAGLTLGRASFEVDLQSKTDLRIPVVAGAVGDHEIRLTTTTPDGEALVKTFILPVRANDPEVLRRSRIPLAANGGSLTVDTGTFSGFRAGTGHATLAVGPLAQFDVPGLLRGLDAYPYGCTEQTTSRAFPLLHFNDVAAAMGLNQSTDIEQRIADAVSKVLASQANAGSFGLWRASSGDGWLDAYVTDFLSQARLKGYAVPDAAMNAALSNLRNRLAYAGDFDSGGEDIAYALMVLAREGSASIGDLRYFADAKAEAFATPLAKAQLGSALAAYGEQKRADRMFRLAASDAVSRPRGRRSLRADYGSTLRDAAGVLALSVEAGSDAVNRESLIRVVNPLGLPQRPTSTQEKAWTLFAAKAVIDDMATGTVTVDGVAASGPMVRVFDDGIAEGRSIVIVNTGERSQDAVLTTHGVPSEPPAAGGNGLSISRRYFTLDGDEVVVDAVARNDRLVVVITVQAEGAPAGRLMVDDPLPAGFEIDNPALLRAGEVESLDWLSVRDTQMAEFRSDRFLAAVDSGEDEMFELAYIVRAVSPGLFYHPAASVGDMYRPEFRANTAAGRVEVLGPLK